MPFADESFDHLTFTYLLRYVDDPGAPPPRRVSCAREELSPRSSSASHAGRASALGALRQGSAPGVGASSATDGARLAASSAGRSASSGRATSLERQLELWRAAGVHQLSVRRLSLGGGVVIWGRKR